MYNRSSILQLLAQRRRRLTSRAAGTPAEAELIALSASGSAASESLVPATQAETAEAELIAALSASGTAASESLGTPVATKLYEDLFTGTNGTELANHSPTDGGSWGWVQHPYNSATSEIQNNSAVSDAATNTAIAYVNEAVADDQYVEAVVEFNADDGFHGVVARLSTSQYDGYEFVYNQFGGGLWDLRRRDNGSSNQLDSVSAGPMSSGVTHTLRLECEGSTIRGYVDGSLTVSATDSTYTSGRIGVQTTPYDSGTLNGYVNSFEGGTLASTPAPAPTGIPTPAPSDLVHIDMRSGGAHSIQSANSWEEASSAAGGLLTRSNCDAPYGLNFTTDLDGAGTRAIRFDWKEGGPSGFDQGCLSPANTYHQQNLLVEKGMNLPASDIYLQYVLYMGATVTGGGVGPVGSFQNSNPSCGPGGHKMLVWYRKDPSGTTVNDDRFTLSSSGASLTVDIGASVDLSDSLNLDQFIARPVTVTLRIRAESFDNAADGIYQMWVDDILVGDHHGVATGHLGFGALQLGGPTWIAPPQDQTMYIYDVLIWERP